MNEVVQIKYQDHIATLIINRPEKMNAVNNEVLEGLIKARKELDYRDDVKVIVLTGAGKKAFCAGADISELGDLDGISLKEKMEAPYIIYDFKKPIIAMIRGYALGGGCEITMACDIRIASENAIFGFPEITLGWTSGSGGTQLLPRLVNEGYAMELLLTGEKINAQRAKEIGLINVVCKDNELEKETYTMAQKIAQNSLVAIKLTKEGVKIAGQIDLHSGFAFDRQLAALCFNTKEKDEGANKFLKR